MHDLSRLPREVLDTTRPASSTETRRPALRLAETGAPVTNTTTQPTPAPEVSDRAKRLVQAIFRKA